eukprot:7955038-Pyramimonas_sp.AAC.3
MPLTVNRDEMMCFYGVLQDGQCPRPFKGGPGGASLSVFCQWLQALLQSAWEGLSLLSIGHVTPKTMKGCWRGLCLFMDE